MHFVNAQEEIEVNENEPNVDELIDLCSALIEDSFQTQLNKNDFHYNRFVMHLRYYIKRIQQEEQFIDSNEPLFETMKENSPKAYECSIAIAELIQQTLKVKSTDDELLYLMIHINRIIKNNQ
ncbi:PRD domain-containing protein [Enterococcus rivorum]